ncbi:HAMP domain-containing protein [Dactylosporangium sp. CA-092794]|uniref:sensor histidine kinase n=1 Tax=Dactylosporangium sp. CA-092794 TaxID=3239929 RepID=UPI003D8C2539
MPGGLVRRLAAASGLLILVLVAVLVAAVVGIRDQRAADQWSDHSAALLDLDARAERLVLELDRAERRYLATHDPAALREWQTERDGLTDALARLERLAHDPGEARLAHRTVLDGQDYVAEQTEQLQGRPTSGQQANERRIALVRGELQRLAADERRLAAQHNRQARATMQRTIVAIVVGLVFAVLVTGWMLKYLVGVVVRPVRRAVAMASRMGRGELNASVPERGAGEIGELNRALNAMSGSVRGHVEDLARYGRTQAALRRIATRVARGEGQREVLDGVAAEIGQLIGADTAHIVRFEADDEGTIMASWAGAGVAVPTGTRLQLAGDNVAAVVRRTGRVARMDSYDEAAGPLAARLRRSGVRKAVGAPIRVEGRLWGAVAAAVIGKRPLPADTAERLADATELIATTVANAQARSDLAASRARVVLAADQARRRIERDLHDGIQQQLIAIAIDAGEVETEVPDTEPQLRQRVAALVQRLTGVLDDLREISRGIHPPLLSERGLRSALKSMARRSRLPVEVDVRVDRRLPEAVEVAAYYITAEALANATKHAHASHVRIEAEADEEVLRLTVRDDGTGGADPARGSGLVGLTDRVDSLGGTLSVHSPPGEGTCLRAELPLGLTALPG